MKTVYCSEMKREKEFAGINLTELSALEVIELGLKMLEIATGIEYAMKATPEGKLKIEEVHSGGVVLDENSRIII